MKERGIYWIGGSITSPLGFTLFTKNKHISLRTDGKCEVTIYSPRKHITSQEANSHFKMWNIYMYKKLCNL